MHTLMYTAYYCAVCPVGSQKGVEENGKKGCASRQRYSLRGVLINESHLSNLRLLLCRCTFTVLQSASQPCASLPQWHNMAQGVGAVTANGLRVSARRGKLDSGYEWKLPDKFDHFSLWVFFFFASHKQPPVEGC